MLIFAPIISNEVGYNFGSTKFVKIKFFLLSGIIINAVFSLFIYSLLIARNSTPEICFYIFLKFFFTTFLSLLFLYSDFVTADTVLDRLLGFFIADIFLNIGFGFYLLRQYFVLRINKIVFFYNLKLALPLVPISVISIVMTLIDRKFILSYHGLSDLADYNLTFQILLPLQVIMSALQVIWAPHIFTIQDHNEAFKKTIRLVCVVSFFMLLGVVGLWLLIKITLYFNLITDSYKNIPQLILFASIGMMSMSLMHLFNNMFVHLNKTVPLLIISIFIAILFYITSFYLISKYSSVGAFISLGIVQTTKLLLAVFLLFLFCKKQSIAFKYQKK
jgi:O-antigen/teichoic acid export membrane protein